LKLTETVCDPRGLASVSSSGLGILSYYGEGPGPVHAIVTAFKRAGIPIDAIVRDASRFPPYAGGYDILPARIFVRADS